MYDRTRTEGIFRNLHLNADVYYNDVKNKIVSWPQGPQFRWTTINLGRVDIRGWMPERPAHWPFPTNGR